MMTRSLTKGSASLIFTRFYNERFLCDYEMAWYPFDIQQCRLILSMSKAFAPFTHLLADKLRWVKEGEENSVDEVMKVAHEFVGAMQVPKIGSNTIILDHFLPLSCF